MATADTFDPGDFPEKWFYGYSWGGRLWPSMRWQREHWKRPDPPTEEADDA